VIYNVQSANNIQVNFLYTNVYANMYPNQIGDLRMNIIPLDFGSDVVSMAIDVIIFLCQDLECFSFSLGPRSFMHFKWFLSPFIITCINRIISMEVLTFFLSVQICNITRNLNGVFLIV